MPATYLCYTGFGQKTNNIKSPGHRLSKLGTERCQKNVTITSELTTRTH